MCQIVPTGIFGASLLFRQKNLGHPMQGGLADDEWFIRRDLVGDWRSVGCDNADPGVDAISPAASYSRLAAHTPSPPGTVFQFGHNGIPARARALAAPLHHRLALVMPAPDGIQARGGPRLPLNASVTRPFWPWVRPAFIGGRAGSQPAPGLRRHDNGT